MKLKNHAVAVALALGVAVGMSACGGEPEVCDDLDTLRTDLEGLKSIEVQPGSVAEFSTALDDIEVDVDRLVDNAASEYESEIDAVQSATRALTSSVETAAQGPSRAAITQVSADFGAFTTAVNGLEAAVRDTC